jgi:hypothetical protein
VNPAGRHPTGKHGQRSSSRALPSRRTLQRILEQELAELRSELPASTEAHVQTVDITFARTTLQRCRQRPYHSSHLIRQIAAGIAWERAISARANQVADTHDELCVLAERWKPKKSGTDLDLIVGDAQKTVIWVIDAKLATPDEDQLHKMRHQIALLKRYPEMTHGCPTFLGVVVHHRRQLEAPYTPTGDPRIHRCTLQQLATLLVRRRVPSDHIHRPRSMPKRRDFT